MRSALIALALSGGFLMLAPEQSLAQKRQRDLITREEIVTSPHKDLDLFQLIRNVRPHFLSAPRGVRSMGGGMQRPIAVYIDGKRQTGLDALYATMAKDVHEVRYLEPARSQNAYGVTANGGAIVVRLSGSKLP